MQPVSYERKAGDQFFLDLILSTLLRDSSHSRVEAGQDSAVALRKGNPVPGGVTGPPCRRRVRGYIHSEMYVLQIG
jgi:hypothetical protein